MCIRDRNLTFLGVVLLNTGIGIVQALRSKRMVDKLTLLASKSVSYTHLHGAAYCNSPTDAWVRPRPCFLVG